jgi:hypothetical protein
MGDPSPAELIERIRHKVRQNFVLLHPDVSEQIEHLKDAKRWKARQSPDDDHNTIVHLDLKQALLDGLAVHTEKLVNAPRWSIVVNGKAMDGRKLSVSVYLMEADADPLLVVSFSQLQDEDED